MQLKLKGTNSYYFALITLLSSVRKYEKKVLKENNLNITPLMLSYIVIIHENESITSKEISEILGVSKSTLSNMIKILINKGFILKESNSRDHRKQDLIVTDKGKEVVILSNKIRLRFKKILRQTLPEDLDKIIHRVFVLD